MCSTADPQYVDPTLWRQADRSNEMTEGKYAVSRDHAWHC